MEIIRIEGYSTQEKIEIARRHLLPKQIEAHGLKKDQVKLDKKVLERIIEDYTRESGVRELDRQIASVMRSVAKAIAMENEYNVKVKESDLEDYLGGKRFDREI